MASSNQPTKIGKYEILSTLGRGGMGVVYKARDPMIDRIVAVKTILIGDEAAGDESLLDRLRMEARSAGRLHHPNIVTVFDFGEENDLSYIVMEFVEGINLARLIDDRKTVSLDAKASILIQIADGLAYAHEQRVIHRDMKPSNVCVTSRGTAKILDFGLARFDNTRLTKTGYMAGTIAYMSPERLGGETGIKDDIFALGAIAYELLTLKRAFPGSMPPEVISKIISPTPPPLPSEVAGVPPELDRIVLRALEKDAAQRYDSAAGFADDLRAFMHSEALEKHLKEQREIIGKSEGEFVDLRPSAHAYAGPSTAKRAASRASTIRLDLPPAEPTQVQAQAAETAIVVDAAATGAQTQPEVELTASAAPTQLLPQRSTRWRVPAIAAAVVILAAIGISVALRKPAPQPQRTPAASHSTAPQPPTSTVTIRDPQAERSELQLATARSLSEELERRPLNSAESMRLSEAKGRIALAEKKLNAGDAEGGAHLISDAIAGLQSVMSENEKRMRQMAQPELNKPSSQPRSTVATTEAPPLSKSAVPPTQSAPPPIAEAPPRVVERPREEPPATPTRPAESPENEIAAFMRQLATAYQSKDVGFFRERSVQFNDQLAAAIRNSPSIRVELQITGIDLQDPQHAKVRVKRTDQFPDPGAPAAVQLLVYNLTRDAAGWKLASISRQ